METQYSTLVRIQSRFRLRTPCLEFILAKKRTRINSGNRFKETSPVPFQCTTLESLAFIEEILCKKKGHEKLRP
jgi:hypothetical protein